MFKPSDVRSEFARRSRLPQDPEPVYDFDSPATGQLTQSS